jgi:hypothetical protein
MSNKNWGFDGASKVLKSEDWRAELVKGIANDPSGLEAKSTISDILEKNRVLVTLPCPLWDIAEAYEALTPVTVSPRATDAECINYLDKLGITVNLRKLLQDKAARQEWIDKMRAILITQNEAKFSKESPKTETPAQESSVNETPVQDSSKIETPMPDSVKNETPVISNPIQETPVILNNTPEAGLDQDDLSVWKYYGFAHTWVSDPDRVTSCMLQGHLKNHVPRPREPEITDVVCPKCNYGYSVDSSK